MVRAVGTAWAAEAAVRRHLVQEIGRPFSGVSLLASAYRLGVPATIRGYRHRRRPHAQRDPAALGRGSYLDFRLFAAQVAELGGGRVYLNVGSAVLLPGCS